MCDPKYSFIFPFCMQLVESAVPLPAGADQHLSYHTLYSQLFSKEESWCFVLAHQLGIEFKTLTHLHGGQQPRGPASATLTHFWAELHLYLPHSLHCVGQQEDFALM